MFSNLTKAFFIVFSLFISILDFKTGEVPRLAFIFAFPALFTMALFSESHLPKKALAGALLGLFVFLLAYLISGKKLGLADVWYSALIGMMLGPLGWYAAIINACISGAFFMLVSKKRQIPFIPFLAFGSTIMAVIQK